MIITHPTLFKKENDLIKTWRIEQVGHTYYAVDGIKDGVQISGKEISCKPGNVGKANETSPIQQASKEIAALYKKKIKVGYSEFANSECKTILKPMLPKSFEEYKDKIEFPIIIQPKIGINLVLTKESGQLIEFFTKHPNAFLEVQLINSKYYTYDGFLEPFEKYFGFDERRESLKKAGLELIGSSVVNSLGMLNYHKENLAKENFGLLIRILNKPYEFGYSKYLLEL